MKLTKVCFIGVLIFFLGWGSTQITHAQSEICAYTGSTTLRADEDLLSFWVGLVFAPGTVVNGVVSTGVTFTDEPILNLVSGQIYTDTTTAIASAPPDSVVWAVFRDTSGPSGNVTIITPPSYTVKCGSTAFPADSPQAVLNQPNLLMPTDVIGGVAATALPFIAPAGSPNAGATEIWSTLTGQKIMNIPPGALRDVAPNTELYPALSEQELASLGIELYRDGDFRLVYVGDGKCDFTFRYPSGIENRYSYTCDTGV